MRKLSKRALKIFVRYLCPFPIAFHFDDKTWGFVFEERGALIPWYLVVTLQLIQFLHGCHFLWLWRTSATAPHVPLNVLTLLVSAQTWFFVNFVYVVFFSIHAQACCSIGNASLKMDDTWRTLLDILSNKPPVKPGMAWKEDVMGLAYLVMDSSAGTPVLIGCSMVYFNVDFLHLFIPHVPHEPLPRAVLKYATRTIVIGIQVHMVWQTVMTLMHILLVYVQPQAELLERMQRSLEVGRERWRSTMYRKRYLPQLLLLHSQMYILNFFSCHMARHLMPFVLSLAMVLSVLGVFGTVRLFPVAKMPWYLGMPLMTSTMILTISVAVPRGAQIFERSKEFKAGLLRVAMTMADVRRVKAVRTTRATVGNFDYMKRSSASEIFKTIVDNSINAILVF